jgi:hypothetical protein
MNPVMNDDELIRRLRAALPAVGGTGPSRDLWPSVVARAGQGPRWSRLDTGVAALVVIALWLFPEWFWFLAYHL